MTNEGDRADQPLNESIESAQNDLGRLRAQLEAAARGEIDTKEVRGEADDYWRDHGPALRTAAASLSEEVRVQTLAELYKWREQLNRQTTQSAAASKSKPDPSDDPHARKPDSNS